YLYAFIIAISTCIGQLILWKDILGKIHIIIPDPYEVKKHIKGTIGFWIPAVAINIFTYLDKIMLGYFTDDSQVGLYESAYKLVRIAITVTTTIATVTVPKMANLYQNNEIEKFRKTVNSSISAVSCISIPMAFGIMAIRNTIVPWFFGPGYDDTKSLLLISSWLAISLGWSSIFGNQVLIACNRENDYTKAVSAAAVVNVILNILLISKYKSYGAMIASVIAEYTGMFIMMYMARKYFVFKMFLVDCMKYFACSVLMYIVTFWTGNMVSPYIVSTFLQMAVGCLVYILCLLMMKDKNLIFLLGLIRNRIYKEKMK
ncbi:MAG: oligosaccharide flippase family protein, partial [Mobilitalea sp.]